MRPLLLSTRLTEVTGGAAIAVTAALRAAPPSASPNPAGAASGVLGVVAANRSPTEAVWQISGDHPLYGLLATCVIAGMASGLLGMVLTVEQRAACQDLKLEPAAQGGVR